MSEAEAEAESQAAAGPETLGDLDPDRQVWISSHSTGTTRRVHLVPGPETASGDESCRYAARAGVRPVAARVLWDDQPVCGVCRRQVVGDE